MTEIKSTSTSSSPAWSRTTKMVIALTKLVSQRRDQPGVPPSSSPAWSSTTKLVIALTIVAAAAAFVVRLRFIIGPLLLSLVLAYLFYPLASFLQRRLRFSWNMAVAAIYIFVIILL